MRFALAMFAALLPYRHWRRLPNTWPIETAALTSGIATLLVGAAIGIPGFLQHAAATSSLGTGAVIEHAARGEDVSLSPAFNGIAIFSFVFLTPTGWLTLYLLATGTLRAAAVWFDDPVGDPILTGVDALVRDSVVRLRGRRDRRTREEREGPAIPDRIVTGGAAGILHCDLVVVSSRRKPGWEPGVVVITDDECYRIGVPVERTVNGRLRTLYPLTAHRDLEAIRNSVRYDLPLVAKADDVLAAGGERRTDGA